MTIQNKKWLADGSPKYQLRKIWEEGESLDFLSPLGRVGGLAVQAWQSLITTPFTSILSLFTISASLYLLSVFVLAIENGGEYLAVTQTEFKMNLFLRDGIADHQSAALLTRLQQVPEVEQIVFRTKDQALQDFRLSLGEQANLLNGLGQKNPIPAYLEIRFKKELISQELFESFAEKYSRDPIVETVHYSKGLLGEFALLLRFFRTSGIVAMILMLIMTGFIIASTVRLALYSRRDEIAIMRLVGATTSFAQVPCLLEGFLQGTIGGILGVFFTWLSFLFLENVLNQANLVNLLLPELHFLSVPSVVLIILAGILVGIAGSYLAVRRFSDV